MRIYNSISSFFIKELNMNLYEHTIIARQDTSPAELKQLTEKYSKIVEKNEGEIVKTENWGLLNLSYLNKKK